MGRELAEKLVKDTKLVDDAVGNPFDPKNPKLSDKFWSKKFG